MKQKNSLVITGITSLFLIFTVLCMVILSLLSLGTARSDLAMSQQSMTLSSDYYNACSTATELCLQIEDHLWNIYAEHPEYDDFFAEINLFSHKDFSYDTEKKQLSTEIPFSDSQSILLCLDILYPDNEHDTILQIQTWKTIVTGTWNPDTKQHIYQGD